MAKDYSKKRVIKRQNKPFAHLSAVMVSFFAGYITALVFDWTSLSGWVSDRLSLNPVPKVEAIAEQRKLPKPKFEFYTILASDQHANSKPEATHPVTSTATPPAVAPTGIPQTASKEPVADKSAALLSAQAQRQIRDLPKPGLTQTSTEKEKAPVQRELYLVQVAAFKNQQDAAKLKGSLLLKGYDVQVAVVGQGGSNWYRVILGPYTSKADAMRAQQSVARSEHINGMIKRAG